MIADVLYCELQRYRKDRSVSPSAPISVAVGNEGTSKGSTRYFVDGAAGVRFPADDGDSATVSIRDSGYDSGRISVGPSSSISSGRAGGYAFSPDPVPPPGADPR